MTDKDSPEWTKEDFARARPAAEALPAAFLKNMRDGKATIRHETDAEFARRRRGKQRAATKELISIRLSPDVLTRFRASGDGWQGRVDQALREWLKRNSPGE